MEYMGQDILLNFGVLVLSTVELKLIIDALQSIDSLSDVSDQTSQIRVSQSSVDVYTAIPGDLLAMVWGSVSYGKKYSEGYPKIFVTAVQLYLGGLLQLY